MIAAAILLFTAAGGALFFQRIEYRGSHPVGNLLIIGGITTTFFGLVLLISQLLDGDYTPWLWAWLAMAAGGAWVTVRIWQADQRLPYPKQFAFAVTFTALLAAANLAYSSLYQPSTQLYTWALDLDFGKPAFNPKRTSASVPITITFHNTGKVAVNVLMATYSVVGRRASVVAEARTKEQLNLAVKDYRPASRHTVVRGYDLLQTDEFIEPGNWLEAGDRTDVGRTVDLPVPTSYDAIALNAWIMVTRRDRATVREEDFEQRKYSWDLQNGHHQSDAPEWVASSRIDTVQYQIPIAEGSYLREQTRKDWVATMWWVLADPTPDYPAGPYIAWRMKPRESKLDAGEQEREWDNERAFKRYDITRWDTGLYEVSVHDLGLSKPPTPKR